MSNTTIVVVILSYWTFWGLLQQAFWDFDELYDIVNITAPSKLQFFGLMWICAMLWPWSEDIRNQVVEWKVEELTDIIA